MAYCFMPDHLHVLANGSSESSDLGRFVSLFKRVSAYRFRRGASETLWAPGYYDHVLRNEEATLTVALYILANPVRAGLVRSIEEYPFSGSDVMPLEEILVAVQMGMQA